MRGQPLSPILSEAIDEDTRRAHDKPVTRLVLDMETVNRIIRESEEDFLRFGHLIPESNFCPDCGHEMFDLIEGVEGQPICLNDNCPSL